MTTGSAHSVGNPTRSAVLAFTADLACVLLFVAVGRRNHAEGVTLAGIAQTAWPFLTGVVVGWLLSRGWRRPTDPIRTGGTVWISTIVIGMVLRVVTGAGTAVSFILVASGFTAALMLGWRGVAARLARRAP